MIKLPSPLSMLIVVGCVAMAGITWQHIKLTRMSAELTRTSEQLSTANKTGDLLRVQLHQVASDAVANDQAQADLRQQLADVAGLASARQKTIEKLKHENQQLKDWADSPLPADIVRLRHRPAVTGAAGYQHWLSETDGLPPAADQPADQRPVTQ